MFLSFQKYIHQTIQLSNEDKFLLAVSGGVDSMVMCQLFLAAKLPFAIAHCNFKLRGVASDGDEEFVKTWAEQHQVSFFSIRFDTNHIAQQQQQSIQVVARDLRYEWLENIRQKHGSQYIATAHHLNDSIETVLYNLTKGCGIHGLHGILPKNKFIIRPLLFATKTQILEYSNQHQIAYREDASNATDKYARNFIRHQVIPKLKAINPSLEATFAKNIHRFRETELLYEQVIQDAKKSLTFEKNELLFIDKTKLQKHVASTTVLYELLKPYHFQSDVVGQIINALDGIAGKQFHSATHWLNLDRTHLIVCPKSPTIDFADAIYTIHATDETILFSNHQLIIKHAFRQDIQLNYDKNIAYLDLKKLTFPLTLRKWQRGDIFQPLGMKGRHQKLSDFFTRQKFSLVEKKNTWVLLSDKRICWVVGHRIDERFKLKNDTSHILRIIFKGRPL